MALKVVGRQVRVVVLFLCQNNCFTITSNMFYYFIIIFMIVLYSTYFFSLLLLIIRIFLYLLFTLWRNSYVLEIFLPGSEGEANSKSFQLSRQLPPEMTDN